MTKIKLIVTENCAPNDLLSQLKSLNWEGIQVEIVWIVEQLKASADLESYVKDNKFLFLMKAYPVDDELHLLEILKEEKNDFVCFFQPSLSYPSDYFSSFFSKKPEEDDGLPNRSDKYMVRLLRAAQQSKYGLGLVKKDIKRNYDELNHSVIYHIEDLKSAGVQELSLSEQTPSEVFEYAQKTNISLKFYQADFKSIEYYRDIDEYSSGIRKDAPSLGFQNKENATGFPFYFLILIWLSLFLAIFVPVGLLVFLVLTAVYFLAIGLEALAISTIKKQGELLMGLVLFFPVIHHLYLFYYLKGIFVKTNNTAK